MDSFPHVTPNISWDQSWTNVTLPYSIWNNTAAEILALDLLYVPRLKIEITTAMLSTLLQGIYTMFVINAAKAIIRRGFNGTTRNLFILTTTMYMATAVYWVAILVGIYRTCNKIATSSENIDSWMTGNSAFCRFAPSNNHGGLYEACLELPNSSQLSGNLDVVQDCIGTTALTINVILGDSIVWWRVWALWRRNRYILLVWVGLVLATSGMGIYDMVSACTSESLRPPSLQGPFSFTSGTNRNNPAPGGSLFIESVEGFIVICLSFSSNAITTALVGYRTWRHRRTMKEAFMGKAGTTQITRVLMLLVESGIAYCVLWLLVLISQSSSYPLNIRTLDFKTNASAARAFIDGCLVPLVGMYPTIIILLVTLNKSEWDKQQFSAGPVPAPPAVRLASIHYSTVPGTNSGLDTSTRRGVLSSFVGLPSFHFSTSGSSSELDEEGKYNAGHSTLVEEEIREIRESSDMQSDSDTCVTSGFIDNV